MFLRGKLRSVKAEAIRGNYKKFIIAIGHSSRSG